MEGREEGGKEASSWTFKVRWNFKTKQEGSKGILCSRNSLSNERWQDGGRVFEEQCVLRLCYSRGVGGAGKLNMGRSLEEGNSEHRAELLIAIRKALGSHQKLWNRQSSKVDQRWAMEEDSGRMRKNWRQETWEERK